MQYIFLFCLGLISYVSYACLNEEHVTKSGKSTIDHFYLGDLTLYKNHNKAELELTLKKLLSEKPVSEEDILSSKEILHFDLHKNKAVTTSSFLPPKKPVKILLTSGASCPDALVEGIIKKLGSFYKVSKTIDEVTAEFA